MSSDSYATDPTLDGAAIRARRLEFGWSVRMFADRLGTTFSTKTVQSLECGDVSRDLSLGDAHRLAEFLNLPAGAIVVTGTTGDADTATTGGSEADLDRQVGAVLASLETAVRREELAAALGTDLDSLSESFDRLNVALAPAGLHVQQAGRNVRLAPVFGAAPYTAVTALARKQLARDDMDIAQASLLSRTARGCGSRR